MYFLKLVLIAAYKSISIIFGLNWLMGEKVRNIIAWASDLVIPTTALFHNKHNFVFKIQNTILSLKDGIELSITEFIAGTILVIIFFLLVTIIVSYGLSIISVGETIIFTILKKKSDNVNLMEREDKDFLELANDEYISKETEDFTQIK
jgi:hypothetical protein